MGTVPWSAYLVRKGDHMHNPTNIPLIPYVVEQTPRGERSYDLGRELLVALQTGLEIGRAHV